jgi:uncharacterized protein YtpQ (UPF0354 family)
MLLRSPNRDQPLSRHEALTCVRSMDYSSVMTSDACRAAMAYLKPLVTADESDEVSVVEGDDAPVLLDLKNGLCVAYLLDEGDRFVYVDQGDLSAAGLSQSELHGLALENLREFSRSKLRVEVHGDVYAVLLDGNFEASLILVAELWERGVAKLLPNGCVAALPARDVLAFCDSESSAGLEELRQVVRRVYPSGDHLLSERLYQRAADGTWSPRQDT